VRRPRRRRGCHAGRRPKPRPPAATSALDQSANCLAAAVSRPSSSTMSYATTTTTITTDDSAQSSVNNQLIAKQSVNTLPSILVINTTSLVKTMPNNILQLKYFLVMQILCLCVKPGSKHTTVIVFLTLTGFSATGWIDVNVEVVVYVCM